MNELDELTRVVDALQRLDVGRVPDGSLCEHIAGLRQQLDRLESVFTEQVAVVHERGAASALGFVTSAAFLRQTCRFTTGAARGRIDLGLQLRDQPAVAEAFAEGAISYAHAALVMKTLNALPDRLAAEALPVMVQAARILDTGRLAQVGRRLRHFVDPDGQGSIDERHHEEQWLEVAQTFAGTFAINGLLDAESGAALVTALEAAMRPSAADDTRTAAQRPAEALLEVVHQALDHGDLPDVCGERPHLLLVSELSTLTREAGAPPAELVFGGPIGVESARRLACDPIVTRVIVADSAVAGRRIMKSGWHSSEVPKRLLDVLPPQLRDPSQPLDVGRSARLATPAIRKALLIRDRGCAIPGCNCPPGQLEAHHIIHWIDGGATAVWNMVLLCRRHHRFVHEKGWSISLRADGSVIFEPPLALTG
jgi:Domain of unknown function (DUF222)/HNH endonuclease